MCEAFYNVFDNAVKYSKNNSTINITMKQTEMFYKIQVRDYGIGIRDGEEIKFFKDFIVVSRQEGRKDAELVYIFPERLFYYKKG